MNIARFRFPSTLAGVAILLVAMAGRVEADGNNTHRYAHRGEVYRTLPREAIEVQHRGSPYFYRGGEWYRPQGTRYVVIAPPLGAVVPFLPGVYATLWFGGIPYYYANDAYYLWRPELNGYVVAQPPAGTPSAAPAAASAASIEPFVYPKNGQTEAQQATDRYECHRWAVSQTSYDPTNPPQDNKPAESARADYVRALTACLAGRGYSVK